MRPRPWRPNPSLDLEFDLVGMVLDISPISEEGLEKIPSDSSPVPVSCLKELSGPLVFFLKTVEKLEGSDPLIKACRTEPFVPRETRSPVCGLIVIIFTLTGRLNLLRGNPS